MPRSSRNGTSSPRPRDTAHRAGIEDDENLGEQLVTDGIEEAAHDQMLEARREELEQEG